MELSCRRRGHLCRIGLAVLLVEQQQIGKRAANVDAEPQAGAERGRARGRRRYARDPPVSIRRKRSSSAASRSSYFLMSSSVLLSLP